MCFRKLLLLSSSQGIFFLRKIETPDSCLIFLPIKIQGQLEFEAASRQQKYLQNNGKGN